MEYKKRNLNEKQIDNMVREYSVDRLFNMQRINLDMLNHYIVRDDIYDRNDCNKILQEIISINLVIDKKLKYAKAKK